MTTRSLAAAVTLAAALGSWWWSSSHGADARAASAVAADPSASIVEVRAQIGAPVREPAVPLASIASVEGALGAGAAAFRAFSDDFVAANAKEVADHMRRERITLDETKELTYFGMLAVTSLDWDAVEQLTGKPVSREARRAADDAMFSSSEEMKKQLRAQVAAGASEAERAQTIARIEDDYLDTYYQVTGMTPELLDRLLLASVENQHIDETAAALAPSAPPLPPGATGGVLVDRHLGPREAPTPPR